MSITDGVSDRASESVAEALTAEALAVDGVSALFPPRNLIAHVAGVIGAVATRAEHSPARVVSSSAGTAPVVAARIATESRLPAPRVARAVADALLRHPDAGSVTVQIAHIGTT